MVLSSRYYGNSQSPTCDILSQVGDIFFIEKNSIILTVTSTFNKDNIQTLNKRVTDIKSRCY